MNRLNSSNNNFLLEVSMEDLHKDIALWLSEIEFWRVELSFFQKLLEKVAIKQPSVEDKKKIDHFQNLIIYYHEEVLDQYQHDVHEHETYLKNVIQNNASVNDQFYREIHKKIRGQLEMLNKTMKAYKKELYAFVEQVF